MPDTNTESNKAVEETKAAFALFNEIGIIGQLSRTLFETRLPEGITVPHFTVLNHLVRLGGTPSPLRLAKAFQVPKTSMTNTLAGLEKRGLILMHPNPEDGRSKCVEITEAGKALRENAISALGPDILQMLSHISVKRIQKILPELQAIRSYLDNNRLPD